jgi:NADPH-dependent glutamate synthase beta subunit-like oxidoreductase/CO/xanthine dehydrogenase FAD-binding subunit
MTLQPFKYIAADSLEAAEALLRQHQGKAAVMAGGTDLLGTLKDAIHPDSPELLVSLKSLQDLRYVEVDTQGVRIGALTTLDEIAAHPLIGERYPLLAEAARSVASSQIRNVATIAGNICQEPRCWYYRNPDNTFECLRKGGASCPALFGENRFHSFYGAMSVDAAPCTLGCPSRINIPAYMARVRAGDLDGAARILLESNPLPAVTGRACPHFCQEVCSRTPYDDTVSIRDVERYLGDYVLERADRFYVAPSEHSGHSVAVVGAGPAGLTAAYYLRRAGHEVTVYDQMPEAGGMLIYSIPAHRLPKSVVVAQVRALEGMGIRFELNARLGGPGLSLADLQARHGAVFVGLGLWQGRNLKIENAALLESGLEFLIGVRKGERRSVGRRVLVIGGGSVSCDVAITALRLGAEKVTMACLESREIMPAQVEDIEQALEEGVELLPSYGPQRVLAKDGKVAGMELVRCTSVFDQDGRFAPAFDPSVTMDVEADQILLAIGQASDLTGLEGQLETGRGLIVKDTMTQATSLAGVYSGGDVASGPATIVAAMADGYKAAQSIHAYLGGEAVQPATGKDIVRLILNEAALPHSERQEVPSLPADQRTLDFEDRTTPGWDAVAWEANRCLNCGCVAVNASDVAPALIALDATVKTTRRTLAAEELFAATTKKTTVLEPDELIEEIRIPALQPGTKQGYLKFRLRNAIDFPIVSMAYCSDMQDGRFHATKLVLGAVAPVPVRARQVEALLEGRTPSEALAREAGVLVAREAQPLARNKYKVEILKGLIRKMIVSG